MNFHHTRAARVSVETVAPLETATSDHVVYATGDSALGKILVARSAVGICAIFMGETEEELVADLTARFPGGALVRNGSSGNEDLAKILRFIDKPSAGLDLQFDMRHGTAFQRRVWGVLLTVPCGSIITYSALARRIGQPEAVRAVASACAANAIALGIPCHRVLRSDGTLSGYRWGVERKRALINREAMS
ncbi:MAG: methylated-DNA--[protein]-cysteine S-methyltransferase [Pseudomonadota bacterium]|jgi:methylated-DNA-[protein]-cysteine S-methyltransferase/AraC family transcriptional regulator of adaptative response/methylated-DNA-[protein]-cysteine methyltransferase